MKAQIGPVELLVIQGTPFCNIDCKYCYLPDRSNKNRISVETIKVALNNLLRDDLIGDQLSISWHAGEPLVLPIDLYRQFFDEIRKILSHKIRIKHHFQTNGILLTQDWCDFIKEQNISVGVSIDGPKYINDFYRLTRKNKGTFQKTMHGINLLKTNNIPFHVIAVITERSLQHAEDIYTFFNNIEVNRLGFNIEEVEGIHTTSSLKNDGTTYKNVYDFYKKINDLQLRSGRKIAFRELDNAKLKILKTPLGSSGVFRMGQQTNPYRIVSIDTEGNFSTFSPELLGQNSKKYDDFILGNVHQTFFRTALETDNYLSLYSDIIEGIRNCQESCEYFSFCGGGAPANKYYENGSFKSTETLHCKYNLQIPLEVVIEKVEKELEYTSTHS